MTSHSRESHERAKDRGFYHTGQLGVQRRMGVEDAAARLAGSVRDTIPPVAVEFLQSLTQVFLGWEDKRKRVWASALVGHPGFMTADENALRIAASPFPGDPLDEVVDGTSVGLLAIEFETRRRMVMAGQVWRHAEHWMLKPERVFSQCPKHIRTRPFPGRRLTAGEVLPAKPRFALSPSDRTWIENATTLLLASHNPHGNSGVSHRGGEAGFVQIVDDRTLEFPDYPGNRMFLTLGNIATHPRAGLLFLDFDTGGLLQMTGEARLLWDAESIQRHPGAQLAVQFKIEEIIEIETRPGTS